MARTERAHRVRPRRVWGLHVWSSRASQPANLGLGHRRRRGQSSRGAAPARSTERRFERTCVHPRRPLADPDRPGPADEGARAVLSNRRAHRPIVRRRLPARSAQSRRGPRRRTPPLAAALSGLRDRPCVRRSRSARNHPQLQLHGRGAARRRSRRAARTLRDGARRRGRQTPICAAVSRMPSCRGCPPIPIC